MADTLPQDEVIFRLHLKSGDVSLIMPVTLEDADYMLIRMALDTAGEMVEAKMKKGHKPEKRLDN